MPQMPSQLHVMTCSTISGIGSSVSMTGASSPLCCLKKPPLLLFQRARLGLSGSLDKHTASGRLGEMHDKCEKYSITCWGLLSSGFVDESSVRTLMLSNSSL